MNCPRFLLSSPSFLIEEGVGRPGAGWHPRSVRKKCTRGGSQGSRSIRPPHAVVLFGLLRALPGETSSIATIATRIFLGAQHPVGANTSTKLDASIGRRNHTTSPHAGALLPGSRWLACAHHRGHERGFFSAFVTRNAHRSRFEPPCESRHADAARVHRIPTHVRDDVRPPLCRVRCAINTINQKFGKAEYF